MPSMKAKRVFVDTNVFLRYLTNDVPDQAEAFETLLKLAADAEFSLVADSLVLAEIVWTLESYYKLPKQEIQTMIFSILNTPGIEIPEKDMILQAALWYVDKNVDFIDAFNAAWMADQGIESVVTFDQKHFSRFEGIRIESIKELL